VHRTWGAVLRSEIGRAYEVPHNVDDLVSKIFIGESFAQPVELLDRAVPRHRVVQPFHVAVLLLHKDTIVLCANRNSGTEFSRIATLKRSSG